MSALTSGTVPEVSADMDPESRAALQRLYQVMDELDTRTRLAFVLRHFEGYELTEVAEALEVSLATAKRALARGQEIIQARIARDPLLAQYAAQRQPQEEVGDVARSTRA